MLYKLMYLLLSLNLVQTIIVCSFLIKSNDKLTVLDNIVNKVDVLQKDVAVLNTSFTPKLEGKMESLLLINDRLNSKIDLNNSLLNNKLEVFHEKTYNKLDSIIDKFQYISEKNTQLVTKLHDKSLSTFEMLGGKLDVALMHSGVNGNQPSLINITNSPSALGAGGNYSPWVFLGVIILSSVALYFGYSFISNSISPSNYFNYFTSFFYKKGGSPDVPPTVGGGPAVGQVDSNNSLLPLQPENSVINNYLSDSDSTVLQFSDASSSVSGIEAIENAVNNGEILDSIVVNTETNEAIVSFANPPESSLTPIPVTYDPTTTPSAILDTVSTVTNTDVNNFLQNMTSLTEQSPALTNAVVKVGSIASHFNMYDF